LGARRDVLRSRCLERGSASDGGDPPVEEEAMTKAKTSSSLPWAIVDLFNLILVDQVVGHEDARRVAQSIANSLGQVLFLRQGTTLSPPVFPTFKVGDGATMSLGLTSLPVTVQRVSPKGEMIWVSKDRVYTNSEQTRRLYVPTPKPLILFSRRKGSEEYETSDGFVLSWGRGPLLPQKGFLPGVL